MNLTPPQKTALLLVITMALALMAFIVSIWIARDS
jgi:hypothetical protein